MRAEVLGPLINSVFLVSLCLTIVIEAVERLFEEKEIHDPKLLLYVGCIGLLINIVGLFVFGHGHSHNVPTIPEDSSSSSSSSESESENEAKIKETASIPNNKKLNPVENTTMLVLEKSSGDNDNDNDKRTSKKKNGNIPKAKKKPTKMSYIM